MTKARFRDWAALHQKYGAASFVTVPLETGAGVLGALTAAGSLKMERRAVEALAARLAEALLRRTMESLLKASPRCQDALSTKLPGHVLATALHVAAAAASRCWRAKRIDHRVRAHSLLHGFRVQHIECDMQHDESMTPSNPRQVLGSLLRGHGLYKVSDMPYCFL